jgi:hypothetical protein
MPINEFPSRGAGGAAYGAFAVTPDDDADLDFVTLGLWVGGAGDVAVVMESGDTVTFEAVTAGTLLPIRVSRVLETDTDATSIVGLR